MVTPGDKASEKPLLIRPPTRDKVAATLPNVNAKLDLIQYYCALVS